MKEEYAWLIPLLMKNENQKEANINRIKVIESFIKIKDVKLQERLNEDLDVVVKQLNDRSSLFIKEAKEIGLKHYPYQSGFFITIPCKNNDEVINELKNYDHLIV